MRERFELWFLNKYPGMSLDTETARHDFEVWMLSWVSCSNAVIDTTLAFLPEVQKAVNEELAIAELQAREDAWQS